MDLKQADSNPVVARPKRRRLSDFPLSFWQVSTTVPATELPSSSHDIDEPADARSDNPAPSAHKESPSVSENAQCVSCKLPFDSFESQRVHFRTDWHKYNVQRRKRDRVAVTEAQFDQLSDLGSHSSLSGTDESDVEQPSLPQLADGVAKMPVRFAERVEFCNPMGDGSFVVVYRACLPDLHSLASLAHRSNWAVIMAGSGHFVAALWDVTGKMLRHKTFHRYTSRKKQGGSQAAADEARGAANRIRSAGATLRRYGEQALVKEVHGLLKSWQAELSSAQCIFVRASQREKRDLLYGLHDSPLKQPLDEGRVRNVPIPTRRATLKEATRVYEELSKVVFSPTSLLEVAKAKEKPHPSANPKPPLPPAKPTAPAEPKGKGTDHLKKRDEKPKPPPPAAPVPVVEEAPPILDERLVLLLQLCLSGDKEALAEQLVGSTDAPSVVFSKYYFDSGDDRFTKVGDPVGLVGVAVLSGNPDLVEWLLDHDVSPAVGAPPYLLSKGKAVRNALRMYWATHPGKFDYEKAGIPAPLTDADVAAQADKERAKRKKERQKKKDKAADKVEAAKPPQQRARELRAAAAEARLLGDRCAGCGKSLKGVTPFERLSFKYCSTVCVNNHRQQLKSM